MAIYQETLETLRNSLLQIKPNLPGETAREFLNRTMRGVITSRPYWSDLLQPIILHIPAPHTTGTITLTVGSAVVTGSATSWPTNNVVNSTLTSAINRPGVHYVEPSSMVGITKDSVLYVDSDGTWPEVVPVLDVSPRAFQAEFRYAHDNGAKLWASSLAGWSLRLDETDPIYTVLAVTSGTSLILNQQWADTGRSGATYRLVKLLYTIATDIRDIVVAVDKRNGRPITIIREQGWLDFHDPQRTSTGDPFRICTAPLNAAGNMQYEVNPEPSEVGQMQLLISRNWPDMVSIRDRPLPGVDPSVILYGALSTAMMHKVIKPGEKIDPYYDPNAALMYQRMFESAYSAAVETDEAKSAEALRRFGVPDAVGDTEFWKAHDIDVMHGRW